jgi:hypothetical protein
VLPATSTRRTAASLAAGTRSPGLGVHVCTAGRAARVGVGVGVAEDPVGKGGTGLVVPEVGVADEPLDGRPEQPAASVPTPSRMAVRRGTSMEDRGHFSLKDVSCPIEPPAADAVAVIVTVPLDGSVRGTL